MEKRIQFTPAYDKRSKDPKKNYGIHGVNLRFVLIGEHGATQFVIFTNWHTPEVQEELDSKLPSARFPYTLHKPLPADVGYHALTPHCEGQTQMECDLLPGGKCYYDGSGLAAEEMFKVLTLNGDAGVWEELEKYYVELFGELK